MTEAYEDGNYLVRVRAQVMSRDDGTGGWMPLGGGGLSNVSVRKRARAAPSAPAPGQETSPPKHDYLIYGKRISDQSIVLSCTIKKDFEYNKVMPTFHHWKTGDKKFGLTFQTAADARAFDKGVRTAVEDLLDGLADGYPNTPLHKYHKDVVDDDVFMQLNLPVEPTDSRSSSDSSTRGGIGEHLHRIHYISRDRPPALERQPFDTPPKGSDDGKGENYSYVQLTAVHEYIYPEVDDQKSGTGGRRDSTSSLKKRAHEQQQQPPLPAKSKHQQQQQQQQLSKKCIRTRCRHCQEVFSADENRRGACEYAPDCVAAGIDRITCISCAQCMFYHCMADAEGEFGPQTCSCAGDDCGKRWFGLTLLSLFVPCLWCYPPLKLCHTCGVRCGMCGGRHSM